eukprot:TRINITY_DN13549_c0_g1_i5.p2 TRINITY_DN13549_c0_g1~~TRINITY_DN13549_c0_g1_i5.p2  ORF type:complete len:227 (-),score=48.47 TRINITY_DN13549_c0_g1_i5:421-1101(-)
MTANDVLPTDKFGYSSMTIADLQWTRNDLSFVVLFASGYFCVMSRLGYALGLVSPKSVVQCFCCFNKFATASVSLSLRSSSFVSYSHSTATLIKLRSLPDENTFTKTLNPLGKTNTLLHLFAFRPELALKEKHQSLLARCLEDEILLHHSRRSAQELSSCQSTSAINFVNPFSGQLKADGRLVLKTALKLIQPLRWQSCLVSGVFETVLQQFTDCLASLLSSSFFD